MWAPRDSSGFADRCDVLPSGMDLNDSSGEVSDEEFESRSTPLAPCDAVGLWGSRQCAVVVAEPFVRLDQSVLRGQDVPVQARGLRVSASTPPQWRHIQVPRRSRI